MAVPDEPDVYHAPLYAKSLKRVESLLPGRSLVQVTYKGTQQQEWAARQREHFTPKPGG